MDDDNGINWDDQVEVASRLVEQFGLSLAELIAQRDHDGTYDELVSGFRDRRLSLALSYDGLIVQEEAPVPPPSGN